MWGSLLDKPWEATLIVRNVRGAKVRASMQIPTLSLPAFLSPVSTSCCRLIVWHFSHGALEGQPKTGN